MNGLHIVPQQYQQSSYQQTMTSPVLQSPQQYNNNPYAQSSTHNPFVTASTVTSPVQATNPCMSPTQNTAAASFNPFMQQATQNPIFSPQQASFQPQEALFSPQQQQFVQSPQPGQSFDMNQQQQLQSPQFTPQSPATYYNPYQQQSQSMIPQPTGRLDKNSIMALYNYPSLTPSQPTQSPQQEYPPSLSGPQAIMPAGVGASPQRSATMPVSGSKNPFAAFGNTG